METVERGSYDSDVLASSLKPSVPYTQTHTCGETSITNTALYIINVMM